MITKKDIIYYIVHHVDVLGLDRGLKQVSYRLAFDESFVKETYLKEKKKTNQMAV